MNFYRFNIINSLFNTKYLFKSKHTKINKLKILMLWIKINFKYLFVSKIITLKKEKIMNYKINTFEYNTIRHLFEEIFLRNEYFFKDKNKKKIIFDCGANIGLSTIFFKWLYPESEIYAFEPDNRSFELLKKNIQQNNLKNVHLINKAITGQEGKVDFYYNIYSPGSLVMSTKKERLKDNKHKKKVDSIQLSKFIKKEKISRINYAKIDIEGSEKELIKDLEKNKCLKIIDKYNIEYHHKLKKTEDSLGSFLKIFENNNYSYQIETKTIPLNEENTPQDIILYIYKKN